MTIYQTKARELAMEILTSDESKDYAHAADTLGADPQNADLMRKFAHARAEYHAIVEGAIGMMRATTGVDEAGACGGGGCCRGRKNG